METISGTENNYHMHHMNEPDDRRTFKQCIALPITTKKISFKLLYSYAQNAHVISTHSLAPLSAHMRRTNFVTPEEETGGGGGGCVGEV